MTEASHAIEDLVGRLRPHEGLGVAVCDVDVLTDGGLELASAAMDTPAELLLRQRREPALDEVGPREAGGREMQMKARVTGQPAMNGRRLVRAGIVENQVHGERGGHPGVDRIEGLAKLSSPRAAVKRADDLAALRVERGKQGRRAVARVVVG